MTKKIANEIKFNMMLFICGVMRTFYRRDRSVDSTRVKDMGKHILVTRKPIKHYFGDN